MITSPKIGQLVYWNDPDNGLCSDFARIVAIRDDGVIELEMCANGHTEALPAELEEIAASFTN